MASDEHFRHPMSADQASSLEMTAALQHLQQKVTERQLAETEWREEGNLLEQLVAQRTAALLQVNQKLMLEVTECHQLEFAIRTNLEKEQEILSRKADFIAKAYHDFRTPLATILIASDLLKSFGERFTDEQKLKQINNIQASVQKMTQLVEDVLLICQGQAGRIELHRIPLQLESFCQEILEEVEIAFSKEHTFTLNSPQALPLIALDEKLLRQMLINLLSNAIKYSPNGGNIQINLGCESERAILQIKDEGIGIPVSDQKDLFEFFHRASNVGNIPGTGLGMAIVKNAVDLHGGTINLESQLGIGTTFTVYLPIPPRN